MATGGNDRHMATPEATRPPGFIPPPVDRSRWRDSGHRSLAKAVSWRLVGSLDTFLLSLLILTWLGPLLGLGGASEPASAVTTASYIAGAELVTKILLYVVHERVWARLRWGLGGGAATHEGVRRSGAKALTWRVVATLDTVLLALLFTGELGLALSIGALEVATKSVLYVVHERAWLRVRFGLRAVAA